MTQAMRANELLPCPFCGGAATIEEVGDTVDGYVRFTAGCTANEADCMGYQSLTTFDRRCDAVTAWNKRAVIPAATADQRLERTAKTLFQYGSRCCWWAANLTYEGLDPIGKSEFDDIVRHVLAAADTALDWTPIEKQAFNALIDLAAETDHALENSEERDDGNLIASDFVAPMAKALEQLEALPDDRPGYIMGPAAKAQWALRRIVPKPAADVAEQRQDEQ